MRIEIKPPLGRRLRLALCLLLGIGLSDFAFAEIGTVTEFHEEKGWGFITDSRGAKIFFNVTGLVDPVQVGDNVSFSVMGLRKGIGATNIRVESSRPTPPSDAGPSDAGPSDESWQETDDSGFDEIDDSFDDDGE